MGTITVTEFVSMDGVMQAPGGEKFKYEGWTFEFDRGEDGGKFKGEELFDAEAQLIGRVTYESFAGAWPEREGMEGRARRVCEADERDAQVPRLLHDQGPGVEQHHGDRRVRGRPRRRSQS